jgi:hypothetical protein
MLYFWRKIEVVPTLKGNYRRKAYNIEELSVTRIIISGPLGCNPLYSGQREVCGGGLRHSRVRRFVWNVGKTDLATRLTVSEDPNPQHTAVESYRSAGKSLARPGRKQATSMSKSLWMKDPTRSREMPSCSAIDLAEIRRSSKISSWIWSIISGVIGLRTCKHSTISQGFKTKRCVYWLVKKVLYSLEILIPTRQKSGRQEENAK